MYRLAVFNILSHNRDDHAKNFSFLIAENGTWKLSPAYDLTFSNGPNGEQSTLVMGEGRKPTISHLVKLGLEAKLSQKLINEAIEQTQNALKRWEHLAKQHDVGKATIGLISHSINQLSNSV